MSHTHCPDCPRCFLTRCPSCDADGHWCACTTEQIAEDRDAIKQRILREVTDLVPPASVGGIPDAQVRDNLLHALMGR